MPSIVSRLVYSFNRSRFLHFEVNGSRMQLWEIKRSTRLEPLYHSKLCFIGGNSVRLYFLVIGSLSLFKSGPFYSPTYAKHDSNKSTTLIDERSKKVNIKCTPSNTDFTVHTAYDKNPTLHLRRMRHQSPIWIWVHSLIRRSGFRIISIKSIGYTSDLLIPRVEGK